MGRPKEWSLSGFKLGPINLIVGMNASGKTRALNIILNLAKQFPPGRLRPQECGYDLTFDAEEGPLQYLLFIEDGKVVKEEVFVNEKPLLTRMPSGEVEIFAKLEGKLLRFQPPPNQPAVVARRDPLQHPFLEPLHEWAQGVRHYPFGTTLGRETLAVFAKDAQELDDRDFNQVVAIFRKGEKTLGRGFVDAVRQDMASMGYDLDDVALHSPEGVKLVQLGVPSEVMGVGVKEQGIEGIIDQPEISQGMFRALSILIQVNYSQMAKRANCILIDDIGEGLDFERSTRLIELLRTKAKESSFQLVMTTNDRYVMNNVPLDEWSVLQRKAGNVRVLNSENSPELFNEFKYTGLSNFSFLEMGFADEPSTEEVAKDE